MAADEQEFTKIVVDSFHSADDKGKGFLTKQDYKVSIIQLFGYKPSKHELNGVWSDFVTANGQQGLELDQFKGIVLPRLFQRDISEHVRQTFLAFDRFCRGFISIEDCQSAFLKVNRSFTGLDVKLMLHVLFSDLATYASGKSECIF